MTAGAADPKLHRNCAEGNFCSRFWGNRTSRLTIRSHMHLWNDFGVMHPSGHDFQAKFAFHLCFLRLDPRIPKKTQKRAC